jgi:hypothetical protein
LLTDISYMIEDSYNEVKKVNLDFH